MGVSSGPLRQPKMIRGLMTADVISSLGPEAPSLVHQLDSHTIYFSPSWMSEEYAAHVGDELVITVPRIAKVESIAAGLGALSGGYDPKFGAVELAEAAEVVDGVMQSFNRTMGASFVAFSDDASLDLAATGLVKAYPDTPRITIASSVIRQSQVVSETAQLQMLDLLHDSVRVVAYPGQARDAEKVYRMTRGVSDTFLESAVGEALTGETSNSAANILQAAQAQEIPLAYVDMNHLDALARVQISTQAKAFILDAVQKGCGVLVPERMVEWEGKQTIAWWQLDPKTGEMVGVGEDGTHQFLVKFVFIALIIVIILLVIVALVLSLIRRWQEEAAARAADIWSYYWRQAVPGATAEGKDRPTIYRDALEDTKNYISRMWGETALDDFKKGLSGSE